MSAVVAPSPGATIAAGAVWPPLCAAAVALRFYARRVQGARLLLDDWLTIPALLLTTGMGAALIVGVARKSLAYPTPPPPAPEHALTQTAPQIVTTRQVEWAFEIMQIPSLASVKLSFIFFYRRIFCTGSNRGFSVITWIMIAIITGWAVSFFFGLIFVCGTHFSAWWTSIQSLNTYCRATLDMEQAFAISDCITDIIVLALPVPLIWGLHVSLSRRLAVIGIFLLGALAVAASMTRMVIFIRAVYYLRSAYSTSGANDLVITSGLYWSMIESGLGLTAACLPTLYSLGKKTFQSTRFRSSSKRRYGSVGSDVQVVPATGRAADINSYAMKSLQPISNMPECHENGIVINKTFERTENMV